MVHKAMVSSGDRMSADQNHSDQNTQDKITVLHVDDDPDFADMVSVYLGREDESIEVITETSAQAAQDKFESTDVDCIVSDYDMPGEDGIEFLESVRREDRNIPFILFTGKGSEEVASEALRRGATDYLQKEGQSELYELLANKIRNAVSQARGKRAERELERRSQAMAQAPIGITLTDPQREDNPVVYANEAFLDITGYSRDEMEGWNHRQLQGPDTEEGPVAEMRRAIEAGESTTVELRNYRKDGELFWNRVSIAPLRNEAGTIINWVGFQEDVTDRKSRQRQLATVNERMTHALDVTDSIIFEIELEDDTVNRHGPFERLFGVPPEEFVSNDDFHEKCVHTEDRAKLRRARRKLANNEATGLTYEFRTHPDHGRIRWLHTEVFARTDSDGNTQKLIGLDTDITERKQREQKLQWLRERTDLALRGTNSYIYEIDFVTGEEHRIGNWSAIHGIDSDSVSSTEEFIENAVHPEDRSTVREAHDRLDAEPGASVSFNYRTNPANGEDTWVETEIEVHCHPSDESLRAIGLATDITTFVEEREELQAD